MKETLNGYIVSGEEIFNYFAREVFESQPKEIQEFLVKTSVLEYMHAGVCDYLLDIKKSKRILSFLDTNHIFVSKVQDNYRYHPLFREFLFGLLKSLCPAAKINALYQNAGSYFIKIRDYFSAVDYFFLSEDYENAAKILEKACRVLPLSAKYYTLLSLLDRLPSEMLHDHPYLCLVKGKILSSLGKWNEGLNILSKTKKMAEQKKDYRMVTEILYQIGCMYLFLMQPNKALFYEKQALKLTGKPNSILKAKILTAIGNVNRALGRYDTAEDLLKQSLKIGIFDHTLIPRRIVGNTNMNLIFWYYFQYCIFHHFLDSISKRTKWCRKGHSNMYVVLIIIYLYIIYQSQSIHIHHRKLRIIYRLEFSNNSIIGIKILGIHLMIFFVQKIKCFVK